MSFDCVFFPRIDSKFNSRCEKVDYNGYCVTRFETTARHHSSILFHLTDSFLSKRPIAVIKFVLLCSISRSKRSSVYFTKMRTNSQVFKFGIPLIVVSVLVGVAMILAITLSGKPRTKGELRKCTSR